MTKLIALFNHKGGVSKTTTTFHLGWMLAEKGHRVLLVDTDPQCNLSGLILGYHGDDEFERFYSTNELNNLKAGLRPAFDALPERMRPVQCTNVLNTRNLFLLPGHIGISEYEVSLSVAQELTGSIQTLQNLPGSIYYLVNETAKSMKIDYVLFDMNPGLSSINQNVLMISDYFIVPNSPDFFSLMALQSLSKILPRWKDWAERAADNPVLSTAAYPFPQKNPTFLGNVIQKYRLRGGQATVGFQNWIDKIGEITRSEFVPALKKRSMVFEDAIYEANSVNSQTFLLEQVPDFNTLIAKSQETRTPVFALTPDQLQRVGVVLEQDLRKIDDFRKTFAGMADKVVALSK